MASVVADIEGARVAYVTLAPGGGAIEDATAHHVAVHLGRAHRLVEKRGRAIRDGLHRRGHVVVTAAGERASMTWDAPTTFLDVAIPRERGALVGQFAHDDPAVRDLAIALARSAFGGSGLELARDANVDALSAHLFAPSRSRSSRGGVAPAALKRVLDRIHDALGEPHRLADLAVIAGLSPFHFTREFRRTTGLSPYAYVVDARVHEAIRLLLQGADIDDVAHRVGMYSRAHLARHLAAKLGVTAGSLRRRAR
jgi:AraC-like DNA-binding protein